MLWCTGKALVYERKFVRPHGVEHLLKMLCCSGNCLTPTSGEKKGAGGGGGISRRIGKHCHIKAAPPGMQGRPQAAGCHWLRMLEPVLSLLSSTLPSTNRTISERMNSTK
mmetsp:Transcript_26143/g.73218  ORF Transcript_26143/g.73218 Transcript_26143/m.73218 type:complete len:110 (+) Transcript_26143:246-575(+)